MLRKLLGVIGLLFAVGCCCIGERGAQKPALESDSSDYSKVDLKRGRWDFMEQSKNRESLQIEEKVLGGIGP